MGSLRCDRSVAPFPLHFTQIPLFEGWGATFPVNRHINRPHVWKETSLWRRLLGSRFGNERDANSGSCSKMVSRALQETGHTHLNSNHLVGYTTLSKSSSVWLQRCSATRRRPNYDFTSAESRGAAGEILGASWRSAAFVHLWNSSAWLRSPGDKMTSWIGLVKSSVIWLTGRWKIKNGPIKSGNFVHYKPKGGK